jgi:tetratricopeptide (TPR) repeat protein
MSLAALLAITQPLKNTDVSFAPGVAEELVDNLTKIHVEDVFHKPIITKGEYVEPIQLQVVCQRLWKKVVSQKLTQITRDQLEDVDKALVDFYVDGMSEASKRTRTKEEIIRKWFDEKLITSSGTRSVVHRGSESTGGLSNNVVNVLENKYLIRKEERSGAQWYELSHDRLIKPIKDSNRKWYEQRRKSRNSLFLKVILPVSIVSLIGIYFVASYMYTQYYTLLHLVGLGDSQEKDGNYSKALASYDNALSINAKYVIALSGKGLVLFALGNYTGADSYFGKALGLNGNDPNALSGKGLI